MFGRTTEQNDIFDNNYDTNDPFAFGNTSAKSVFLVFYTPDAERVESEPYLDQMSWYTKIARNMSHQANIINSAYTAKTLIWNAKDKLLGMSDETYASLVTDKANGCLYLPSVCQYAVWQDNSESDWRSVNQRQNKEEQRQEQQQLRLFQSDNEEVSSVTAPLDHPQVALVGSEVVSWTSLGERTLELCRPHYSHVEMVLDNCTYTIRWGEQISKQNQKTYQSRCSVYTTLQLNLKNEAYVRLKEYCDSAYISVDGFNYYGLYFNFLTPDIIKYYLCKNGRSYWRDNAVFCSEFLARALCHVGVFTDVNQQFVNEKLEATIREHPCNYALKFRLEEELKPYIDLHGRVLIDPATTSPNMLYTFIMMKKHLCRTNSGSAGTSEDPFYGNGLYHILESLVPTSNVGASNQWDTW